MRRLIKRGSKVHTQLGTNNVSPTPNQEPIECEPSGLGLINIARRGDNILIVERSTDGVVFRERCGEYSCFIRNEWDANTLRSIREHRSVKGMITEGDWIRVLWTGSREREAGCLALHASGMQTYEGDVNPVRRYMTDKDIKLAKPRVAYLDIETDSRVW